MPQFLATRGDDRPKVVQALHRKLVNLTAEIKATEAKLDRLKADRTNVEATYRLFSPTIDLTLVVARTAPARRRPLPSLTLDLLDVLRLASSPMTARDIAEAIAARDGDLTPISQNTLDSLRRLLRTYATRGVSEMAGLRGREQTWRIKPR